MSSSLCNKHRLSLLSIIQLRVFLVLLTCGLPGHAGDRCDAVEDDGDDIDGKTDDELNVVLSVQFSLINTSINWSIKSLSRPPLQRSSRSCW